jgi:hypothetical protein
MAALTTDGYLLIADISGYTAFLTASELEHAQGIIRDLTKAILGQLVPAFDLVKLEGDAVFCHAPAARFDDGEHVLEAIEVCYVEFRDFLDDVARATTCRCSACANMQTLDLKFVAHFGRYLIDEIAGVRDLAGTDVIVVHRLLKNDVTAKTGLRAYALLTDACRERLPERLQLTPYSETYENLGQVSGGVHDLASVLQDRREARRVYLEPADADYEFPFALPVSPAVAWQYFIDPAKRMLYDRSLESVDFQLNETGRTGIGADMHCGHGSFETLSRIVDWRPYHYFSQRGQPLRGGFRAPPAMLVTVEFEERPDGCLVRYRGRFDASGLNRLRARAFTPVVRRDFRKQEERLQALLSAHGTSPLEDPPVQETAPVRR